MTTRPKRTPFQVVNHQLIQRKEPTADGNNLEATKPPEGDPPKQHHEPQAVFSRPNFNIGRKRSQQQPVAQHPTRGQSVEESKGEQNPPPTVASKHKLYPGLVEVGKRIVPSAEEQPPVASGIDRIMLRPNMGVKNRRKEYDLLLAVPPEETSVPPKSPAFNEGYPQKHIGSREAARNSPFQPEPVIERNTSFVPEMGPPPIFTGELEDLAININQDGKHVSMGKVERQKERAQQLRKLLNLQMDTYEPLLNIPSVTEYDSYISRIKSGYINNSQDQAFDDTMDEQCQTLPLAFQDFSQQCPEDRNRTYIGGTLEGQRSSQSISLYNFVSRVATVIEELLRPSKSFEMPPIFLLSLNPKFVSLSYCPYPTTLYQAGEFSIATIGEKLYVCRGQVTCLMGLGKFMLAGTREGAVMLWAGNFDRGSLYDAVHSFLNNSDFELPIFSTESIEKESYFKFTSSVRRLVEKSPSEFYSLEEFGKIICWAIVADQNNYNELVYRLKPVSYISLTTLYCEPNLLCYDMERDVEGTLFVCTSRGIVRATTQVGQPQLFQTDSRCSRVYLSRKGNIMYTLCQDNSVQIFDRSLSFCLLKFEVPTKHTITEILIPRIETDSRELQVLNEFYVVDSKGVVYRYNLMENRTEPREILSKEQSQDRNLVGVCVSIQDGQLEFLFVNRELLTTLTAQPCVVNLDKSTANLKKVIEDNRRFREVLEENVSL